mgnify:CR=1 FL=1
MAEIKAGLFHTLFIVIFLLAMRFEIPKDEVILLNFLKNLTITVN